MDKIKNYSILLALFASLLLVACPEAGTTDPGDPGGSTLPEKASNVTAVETMDAYDDAVAEITWDGNPNDGAYSVVIDTVSPHGTPPMMEMPDSTSGTQYTFPDYGDYYFWIVPTDVESSLHYDLETAANDGDPVSYVDSTVPIGDPQLTLETDSGLSVPATGTSEAIYIVPDYPDSAYLAKGIEFRYRIVDGSWVTAYSAERLFLTADVGDYTVEVRFWDTSLGQLADGSSTVSETFTILDTTAPVITSMTDSESTEIGSGDVTSMDVTLSAEKPASASAGGTFEYTLDGGASWSAFSNGTQHIFTGTDNQETLYEGAIRYIGIVTSDETVFPSFTIDKKAPVFTEPTVSSADLAVEVSWTSPADSDLQSIAIETSAASAGSWETFATYTSGSIPASKPTLLQHPKPLI